MSEDQPRMPEASGERTKYDDQFDGMPMPRELADQMRTEREARAAEVLDLASTATDAVRYGFPKAALGSDQPEMMGVLLGHQEGDQVQWQHVPISRVTEAVSGAAKVEYFYETPQQPMQARVTRGERSWEMPANRYSMLQGNADAAWLELNLNAERGRYINIPSAPQASIKPISLPPSAPRR